MSKLEYAKPREGSPGKRPGLMSDKLKEIKMNDKLERAHERINEMGFTPKQQEFIFADWLDMNDHLSWLLSASKKEIEDWIDLGSNASDFF